MILPACIHYGVGTRAASNRHRQSTKKEHKQSRYKERKERMSELITIRNDRYRDRGHGAQTIRYASLYMELASKKTNGAVGLASFPPPICHAISVHHLYTLLPHSSVMPTAKVRCRGCGRFFVSRNLSQHVTKSRDPRCQSMLRAASRAQTGSDSVQRMGIPLPPNPNNAAPISNGGDSAYDTDILQGEFARYMWRI